MNIHAPIDRNRAQAVTQATIFPAANPSAKAGRIGVLLSNLGTPDATD
jgi:hypothetical protein